MNKIAEGIDFSALKGNQYDWTLARLLTKGIEVPSPQGESAWRLPPVTLAYDLRCEGNEADRIVLPIPKRDFYKNVFSAIGEIIAFFNGVTTHEELKKFGCNWWRRWTSKEYLEHCGLDLKPGELGPGSYGAALHDFPTAEGIPFNQVRHVVEQIKELPYLRTHLMTTWIPQYVGRGKGKKRQVAVAPCHGTVIDFVPNLQTNELSLYHVQRSGDVPVGVAGNIVQYCASLLMAAHVTGYRPAFYYHIILDPHMYERQVEPVKEYLKLEEKEFPQLVLKNTGITDIFAFRNTDFELENYLERPAINMPTPT
ncbi:MAG: thymidylate synthase [Parcubacteria group bacterium]